MRILEEEGAGEVGGVFHCFTETRAVAEAALALGFHISISGIVTFKNALQVKDVAGLVPLDRLLVETDAPYLAPVPIAANSTTRRWYATSPRKSQSSEASVSRSWQMPPQQLFRLFGVDKNA